MIDDEDKDVERRDARKAWNERHARASWKMIEACMDAEEGSVANMALKHHSTNASNYGRRLLDCGICDEEILGDEGYHVVDDINAAVLGAFIAGYTTAITGEVK
jgi:hypothetical protein